MSKNAAVRLLFMVLYISLIATSLSSAEDFPFFNTRLGTQTFAPSYHFTTETRLVETAHAIYGMGSDVIKIALASNSDGQYYMPSLSDRGIDSLTKLAADEPSFKEVFGMPFRYYVVWAYPMCENQNPFQQGYPQANHQAAYKELYDLTQYLLRTYNGSGKTFFLGHWEGDWMLKFNYDINTVPSATAIQGMTDWYLLRQRAIDQAKADTPHTNVEVLHYVEVNDVVNAMEKGAKTIVNDILPNITVDLVSYSSYDSSGISPTKLVTALNYIRSKAKTSGNFSKDPNVKDVFVGEYGFPNDFGNRTPQQQADQTRAIFKAAMNWGCPFVLYWEIYNNEVTDQGQRGFWLIDDTGAKQPAYYDHQNFLAKANVFKNMYRFWLGRNPDEAAYSTFCKNYASVSISTLTNSFLRSAEYTGRVTNAEFVSTLFDSLLEVRDTADPDYISYLNQLGAAQTRDAILTQMLNSARFKAKVNNDGFARMLTYGTLRKNPFAADWDTTLTSLKARLDNGDARSTVWRDCLDGQDFMLAELALRPVSMIGAAEIRQKFFFDLGVIGKAVKSKAMQTWTAYE